jgi:hypothetical protein
MCYKRQTVAEQHSQKLDMDKFLLDNAQTSSNIYSTANIEVLPSPPSLRSVTDSSDDDEDEDNVPIQMTLSKTGKAQTATIPQTNRLLIFPHF